MSVNEKMTAIADAIREKTGKTDSLTLNQMAEEIKGIQAGGGFPELIYETEFEVETTVTATSATLCTISTGLASTLVTASKEILFSVITCEPTDTTVQHYEKSVQMLTPVRGVIQDAGTSLNTNAVQTRNARTGNEDWFTSDKYGVKITKITIGFATLTIGAVNSSNYYTAAGKYRLKLYRTGVNMLD